MDLLDRLLGHDAWTTRQLLEKALDLSEEQLDFEFDLGHRSVRRTFEHVLWNLECWTDLMRQVTVRERRRERQSVAAMIKRHDAAAAQFATTAREAASSGRLEHVFPDSLADPPCDHTLGGAILHVATHGMHHRAQLLYMLRRLGIRDLPEGDALSWEQTAQQVMSESLGDLAGDNHRNRIGPEPSDGTRHAHPRRRTSVQFSFACRRLTHSKSCRAAGCRHAA